MRSPAERRILVAVIAILAFGAALRTVQYAAATSMWLDELAIALNVTGRTLPELLFRPLDLHQVAPPGFLALEKLGVRLLGPGEAGLRLFPWLAGLGSLVLFWRVARRFVEGLELLAGLLVFAASPSLVWLGGTAKQYSGDVFVILLLLLLALRLEEERNRTRAAALGGALGGVAILASHPAVLVAAGLVVVLVLRRLRARRPLTPALALGAGWAVGAALVTAASLFVVPPELRDAMNASWSNDFVATARGAWGPVTWLPLRLYGVFGYLLLYVSPKSILENGYLIAFSALVLTGMWALARRRPGTASLLAVPVLVGVLAGIIRLLPLFNRIALYLAPVFLIAAMAGMGELRIWLSGRRRTVATLAALGLFAFPAAAVLAIGRPPYRAEEARPVLRELAARWRPGDQIYVYSSAGLAMRFYGPDIPWDVGAQSRGDSRVSYREIDRYRGEPRVWFFHTHGFPCEPEAIELYLEAIGNEIDRIDDPYGLVGQRGAGARLYDLSDPARLARADAESQPRPTPTPEPWYRQACGYSRQPNTMDADRRDP